MTVNDNDPRWASAVKTSHVATTVAATLNATDSARWTANPGQEQRFFATLDAIRGVAALLVVLRHSGSLWGVEFESSYLAVDVFFVLSGVVIANAYEAKLLNSMSFKEFSWRRIVRVYPLYVLGAFIAVCGLVVGFPSSIRPQDLAMLTICAALFIPVVPVSTTGGPAFMFPLNPASWSLLCELIVNAFYAAFVRRLTWRPIAVIMAASAGGCIFTIGYIHTHNLDSGFTLKSTPGGISRTAYSFFAGVMLARLYRYANIKPAGAAISTYRSIVILIAIVLLLAADPPKVLVPFFSFFAVTLIIPALIWAAMHYEPEGRLRELYKFLGAISFALYTLHDPLLFWFKNGVRMIAPTGLQTWGPVLGVVYLTTTIAACWCIHKRLDEPLRRRLMLAGRTNTSCEKKSR